HTRSDRDWSSDVCSSDLRQVEVWARPNQTLLEVLRDEVGATEVKYGCGEGICGTCTVLIDGESVNSCLMYGVQAEGTAITTLKEIGRASCRERVEITEEG